MSEDDHGVAEVLLAELEAGGELVDVGGFSIDASRARAKLREFQLADPYEYALLLVEAAVLGGADPVRVSSDLGLLTISLGPLRISRGELEQLFAAAFVDLSGVDGAERSRRRALQKLAFGCNAALSLNPKSVEVELVSAESALCLELRVHGPERGELRSLPAAGERSPEVRVRVDHGAKIRELREIALIRERCRFSTHRIEIRGEPVSFGHSSALHVELDPERPAFSSNIRKLRPIELDGRSIGRAGLRYGDGAPAEVWILTNGVLAEHFEFGDEQREARANFGAVVELDLPKDLGQTKLARGPAYERVIAAIWAVHDQYTETQEIARSHRAALTTPSPLQSFPVTGLGVLGIVSGTVMALSGFSVGFGLPLLFVSVLAVVLHGRQPQ